MHRLRQETTHLAELGQQATWWPIKDVLFSRQVVSDSFEIPWTIVGQAPLSMGFSRQKYWSGLPFPSPGDRPNPGIKPTSPDLAGGFFTTEPLGKPIPNSWNL